MKQLLVWTTLIGFSSIGGAVWAAAPQADSASYRFELRALGGNVGEAVLSLGKVKRVGKRSLRPVRIDATTGGLAEKVMKTTVSATDWVDTSSGFPARGRWDSEDKKGKRIVKARYDGKRIRGEDFRNGKLRRKLDKTLKQRANGLVSVFGWLINQKSLTPGTKIETPIYDGRRVYHATFSVASVERIHVPVGVRKALKVTVKVTRPDKACYRKDLTFWIDPKDHTPYKLAFSYGVLGDVVAALTGKKIS